MSRVILHCDMNNCFASVEAVYNPSLRGKAVAVCGSVEERHGIVLAKSEEAKRYGIKTGETVFMAKNKCPDLIIVPPHYDRYLKYSLLAREIYSDYTDMVEPFGLDECWLDVTGSRLLFGSGEEIAEKIRKRIKKELGLTVSIGVSFNKVFSKLGSDIKKPDAVTVISEENFKEKVFPLPASDLLGIGRATEKKLLLLGIKTIGDLAGTPPSVLESKLGKNGITLYRFANGTENSPVRLINTSPPVKSLGHGITCTRDLLTLNDIKRVFIYLSEDLSKRLISGNMKARSLQIAVKSNNLVVHQARSTIGFSTNSEKLISEASFNIFCQNFDLKTPIRALSISAINLTDADEPMQTDLYSDFRTIERYERLQLAIHGVRERFGNNGIMEACLLEDISIPSNHPEIRTLPGPVFGMN